MSGVSSGIYIQVLLKASFHTTTQGARPPYIYILRQSADLRGDICVMRLALILSGSFHGYQKKLWGRQ